MSGLVLGSFAILFLLILLTGVKKTAKQWRRMVYGGAMAALLVFVTSGCGMNTSEAATISQTTTKAPASAKATVDHASKDQTEKSAEAKMSVSAKSSTPSKSSNATKSSNSKSLVTAESVSTNLIPVVVAKNVDGDTIHVRRSNGKVEDVRLLLIDTPEDVSPSKPVEPFGYTAANYAKQVLPVGKHVYIEEGVSGYTRDKYGRLLAYLYITPHDMYNLDVVKKGYARVAYIYPPNTRHLNELQAAQNYAKTHHEGIWSIKNYVTPNGYNLSIACTYAKSHGYSAHGCYTTGSSKTSSSNTQATHSNGSTTQSKGSSQGTVTGNQLSVRDGGEASITVKTKPYASGSIEVDYKSGPSKAKGLGPKKANSQGVIAWSWMVGSNTTPGTYNVIIRVGGQTITRHLVVTR